MQIYHRMKISPTFVGGVVEKSVRYLDDVLDDRIERTRFQLVRFRQFYQYGVDGEDVDVDLKPALQDRLGSFQKGPQVLRSERRHHANQRVARRFSHRVAARLEERADFGEHSERGTNKSTVQKCQSNFGRFPPCLTIKLMFKDYFCQTISNSSPKLLDTFATR